MLEVERAVRAVYRRYVRLGGKLAGTGSTSEQVLVRSATAGDELPDGQAGDRYVGMYIVHEARCFYHSVRRASYRNASRKSEAQDPIRLKPNPQSRIGSIASTRRKGVVR